MIITNTAQLKFEINLSLIVGIFKLRDGASRVDWLGGLSVCRPVGLSMENFDDFVSKQA